MERQSEIPAATAAAPCERQSRCRLERLEKNISKRVTIYDIAKELNISTATVNRALTGKGRVSDRTKARVFEAADRMGFKPNFLARSLARRAVRIAVLAFTSFPEFHNQFVQGARDTYDALCDHNITVDFFRYDEGSFNSPEAETYLERTLRRIATEGYDGALICARAAAGFELLRQRGIAVATAVNDVDPTLRRFCVRYNGRVAGRLAVELLYRMGNREKSVAIATGGIEQRSIHAEITSGFMEEMNIHPLRLASIFCHNDDEPLAYTETLRVLDEYPDLGSIYVNSFNSRSILRAVCKRGRAGKLCIVTSDVYGELRPYIREGVVSATIFQDQYEQGRMGLRLLYQSIAEDLVVKDTVLISPQVVLSSNMDLY